MESAVYSMFRVDIRSSVKNDIYITKEYHISLTEIWHMPYWLFEYYLDAILKIRKEEDEQQKAQEQEQMSKYKMPDYSKMQQNMGSNFKMPSFSNSSFGSFGSLPSF